MKTILSVIFFTGLTVKGYSQYEYSNKRSYSGMTQDERRGLEELEIRHLERLNKMAYEARTQSNELRESEIRLKTLEFKLQKAKEDARREREALTNAPEGSKSQTNVLEDPNLKDSKTAVNAAQLTKEFADSKKQGDRHVAANPVFITKIDEDNEDILKLANGAVVEIIDGFLGFVGFRKDAVLFKNGGAWKIWIEDKRTFNCDIIKAPENRFSGAGESISISEVKGGGKILTSLDGSLFKVSDIYTIQTSLWLGPFEALLIDGTRLLNLDAGGEIIDITKSR